MTTKYILESEMSNSETSPRARGFCADSCGAHAITRAATYSSLQEKALTSTSIQLHKISTGASCETRLAGRFPAFSAAHRKHSCLKHQMGACKGAWARRSAGLADLNQLISPHIPSSSSPATPHSCQHNCMYGGMVNQTKQLQVPDL